MLAGQPAIKDLALTTNGVLLSTQAAALKAAGLHRVTVSLDTLHADRFRLITRLNAHDEVLEGIRVAHQVFGALKIDTVVVRGVNDDELVDLIEFGKSVGAEVRFIEYMDVGGATMWSVDQVVSRREMLDVLSRRYGPIEPKDERGVRTSRPVRSARWHDVRHHLVHDRPVLPELRSEPADGRRPVVPLSLCGAGARSERPAQTQAPSNDDIRRLLQSNWMASR